MEGTPLDGVRILALEQMQALPFATQLLARLGADVVKIESTHGDQGRTALPAITDPDGRTVGATFLRNNLNKRSVCVDLKNPRGRDLVLGLAPHFDVVAENSRPGAMAKLGLGYEDIVAVHPTVVYLSVSGFGNSVPSPYREWPAFASIVESMSGIYEMKRPEGRPPTMAPVGALGDISAALFATIGVLAALRQRDLTGKSQYIDIAMLDSVVAMTDIVTNFWSMGIRRDPDRDLRNPVILDSFRASDGWLMLQVSRRHQFERFADLLGRPDWKDDARLATPWGWADHAEDLIRPAVEQWAAGLTKLEAASQLAAAGIAAAPCNGPDDVVRDPHVRDHHMLVEIPRFDGVEQPVLGAGNPVKLSAMPDQPNGHVPRLGEDTDAVLDELLGLDEGEITRLREAGVVG